jgi:phosphoglycerate dehydrogenase-like enzyme
MRILLMYEPDKNHLEALQAAAPKAEIVWAKNEEMAREQIRRADAVLGNRYFLQSIAFAEKLQWMQSGSSGVDLILKSDQIPRLVQITSAKAIYDEEIAEHTLALIFSLYRQLHLFRDDQKNKIWNRRPLPKLSQRRVLILGWGGIGQAIGRKLLALGAIVHAVVRNPRISDSMNVSLYGPDNWHSILPQIDLLVVALPLTSSTRQMVSRPILQGLPKHAYLVNVSRGDVVDEQALLEQIRSHQLQGAALDVFVEEPLTATSPLWEEERILITPHVARSLEHSSYGWEPLFIENLRRFYCGEPLLNQVDRQSGY